MSSSVFSDRTKHLMIRSLKNLMATKSLDKISIREITEDCGVNRQTFYYHFEDIYDQIKWMISYDIVLPLNQYKGTLMWQDGIYRVLSYLEDNREIYINVLGSKYVERLAQCFSEDFYDLIYHTISRYDECNIFSEDYMDFLTQYYMVSLVAIASRWLHGKLKQTAAELASMIDLMFHTRLLGVRLLPEVDDNYSSKED